MRNFKGIWSEHRNALSGAVQHIGRCPKCMRQSLALAALSSAAFLASLPLLGFKTSFLASALFWLSVATGLLWTVHVLVFAKRRVTQSPTEDTNTPSSRRQALIVIGKAVAGAFLVAALPSRGEAWGECSGRGNCGLTQCRTGVTCCPREFPILSPCDCKCYRDSAHTRCQRVIYCP